MPTERIQQQALLVDAEARFQHSVGGWFRHQMPMTQGGHRVRKHRRRRSDGAPSKAAAVAVQAQAGQAGMPPGAGADAILSCPFCGFQSAEYGPLLVSFSRLIKFSNNFCLFYFIFSFSLHFYTFPFYNNQQSCKWRRPANKKTWQSRSTWRTHIQKTTARFSVVAGLIVGLAAPDHVPATTAAVATATARLELCIASHDRRWAHRQIHRGLRQLAVLFLLVLVLVLHPASILPLSSSVGRRRTATA